MTLRDRCMNLAEEMVYCPSSAACNCRQTAAHMLEVFACKIRNEALEEAADMFEQMPSYDFNDEYGGAPLELARDIRALKIVAEQDKRRHHNQEF